VEASRVGLSVAPNATIIGTMDQFNDILLHEAVDEVVFAMPLKKIDNALECIGFAEKLGVKVRVMPDWQIQKLMYQPEIASVYIENFVGIPTLALSSAPQKALELFIKSVLDRSVAALGLVLLAPFFLVIAVLIKTSSRGPVFFVQQRSGLNGRLFNLYKFRTMVVDAEDLKAALDHENEMDGPVFKIKNDPRITRVGAFLRRTSLDELPQLINVLRGEMSLVGPRPPIPTEVQQYAPWQRRRLSMRPGLTCIWQVSGRNEISFEQWMNMDLEYIDKWSLLLDFKLLLKTVPAVVWGTGR
jgi:exopolysaccharide biosynthesis polyprenyl glycosylphosphotransferase